MGAFSRTAGVAVEDHRALEERLQDRAQGVMRHPVPEIRGRDRPRLGVRYVKRPVGQRSVAAVQYLALKAQNLALHIEEERRRGQTVAFAAGGALGRRD